MSSFVEADIGALSKAIKGGVLEVDYPSGQRVRFQKLDDMLKLRALMLRELYGSGGKPALAEMDTGL